MIQLKISGRAGNQMFQYATVYSFMKSNNIDETIYISFQELKRKETDTISFFDVLKYFNLKKYTVIENVHMTNYQKILDILYKTSIKVLRLYRKILNSSLKEKDYNLIDRIWHKVLNKNGLYYYIPTNPNFYKSKTNNIIFYGAFESENYFMKYRDDILKIFTPKEEKNKENEELYKKAQNANSVCVTIRRGDFLLNQFKKSYYICTPNYFKEAIQKICNIINNPQFIVFSDDVEWCKKNMTFPKGTLFESGKDEIYEKIRLMYSCNNFILSNSTFSWWAQYLSRNNKKIVIAPKIWNKFEYSNQIYSQDWILI